VAGVNPFLAGLACRCPECGRGPMFAGFLELADVCPACGFDLRRADSGDGPAVFIILIVGFVACFGALFTDLALRPPIGLTLSIWMPLAALLALGLLRPFKGVMIALQFHNRAAEARHGQP
jgi:uncharacterized protein (DUF983 family)